MKKILKTILIIFIIFIFIVMCLPDDIVNEGEQTFTLMIYINGSDLETDGGYATTDITEMLYATKDEKINVVIQTGGTTTWQDYNIENNERYIIEDNELVLVDDNFSQSNMLNPDSLTDFINYSTTNYEADRYGLIMWNHGGGSISGFGYDETIEGDDTLTIDEIETALNNSNQKLDFVGFDACLMGTIETAYMLKDNADYLIASEELEPGTGWDYTAILNHLSSNTDMTTLDLGKEIANSFVDSNTGLLFDEEATLSVVNVNSMDSVLNTLTDYMNEIDVELLQTQDFITVSKAINKTKTFGYGEVDTIDLYHLAQNLPNDHSDKLIEELEQVIEYNVTTSIMEDSNGLSIYIPYTNLDYYSKMTNIFNNLGINQTYINVLNKIANTIAGGMDVSRNVNGDIIDENNYSSESWYDQSYIDSYSNYYEETEYEDLIITDAGNYFILELTQEDWEIINSITCEVLYDDGEGYIDLGSDNYFELTDDDNLIVSFDGTWISLDDNIVPFYVIEETDILTKAIVPAYLNDELVNIVVVWDEKNPDGTVIGATPQEDYGSTSIETRRLIEIEEGDKIEFLFDYYTYDGEYDDSYIIGEPYIVEDKNIKIEYQEVGDGEFYIYYKITDIYNNEYYTEAVIIS